MVANIVIDASSVINLHNAGALGLASRMQGVRFWLSPIVLGECSPTCAAELAKLSSENSISLVDDALVPSELYLSLLTQYDLGEGETEAIAICHVTGFGFCCDDLRARRLGERILTADRIVGSAKILNLCVIEKVFTCLDAFSRFMKMREKGGFLPKIEREYFCQLQTDC